MKCPDCGSQLKPTEVVGQDKSFRCGVCGGVWLEGWVINRVAEDGDLKIQAQTGGQANAGEEGLVCPADSSKLVWEEGDNLPAGVKVWRCRKCNRWWLPGNNIFSLKQAFEVKTEYQRLWNRGRRLSSLAMPVVLTLVLIAGLGVVVMAVRYRQQLDTEAASPVIGRIIAMYLGDNRVQVRFQTIRDIGMVMYKRDTDEIWEEALVLSEGDWKVVVISGVSPGVKLWLSVEGQVWRLTVGQRQ